jgi:ADP-ribose pyrophosphatase YjhB (NUDIX family)
MKTKTIFFQHKAIHFVEKTHEEKLLSLHFSPTLKLENLIAKNEVSQTIYCENVDKAFFQFISKYKIIEAAGGLTRNTDNAILMIQRHGLWDLPKGKYETGETIGGCAMREVQEECGIVQIDIENFLGDTYHCYYLNEVLVVKKTYWFNMRSTDTKRLKPQTEEGITKVLWCKEKDLAVKKKNMYAAIAWVLGKLNY